MLSNAYFLAKFRFDTAENEPAKNLQNFRKMHFRKMHFRKMHFRKMRAARWEVRQHHNDPAIPALSHDNDAECVLENVEDFRVVHQWDASVAKKSDGLGVCLESLKTEEHVKVRSVFCLRTSSSRTT